MAKQSSVNLDITNNADGFDISGGTTVRKLGITGGDVTIAGSGSAVVTFPTTSTTIAGLGITQSFSALQSFSAGISSAGGVTLSGTLQGTTANFTGLVSSTVGFSGPGTNITGVVTSFNNQTGAVTGLTAVGGTYGSIQYKSAEGLCGSPYLILGYAPYSAYNNTILKFIGPTGEDGVAVNAQQGLEFSRVSDGLGLDEGGGAGINSTGYDPANSGIANLYIGAVDGSDDDLNSSIKFGFKHTSGTWVTYAQLDRYPMADPLFTINNGCVLYIDSGLQTSAASNSTFLGPANFQGLFTGVTASFTGLVSASKGISTSGGVTLSGNFSGATGSFSRLLTASAGISASNITTDYLVVAAGSTFGAAVDHVFGLSNRGLKINAGKGNSEILSYGNDTLDVNALGGNGTLNLFGGNVTVGDDGNNDGTQITVADTGGQLITYTASGGHVFNGIGSFSGILTASVGISAAGGVTFAGTVSSDTGYRISSSAFNTQTGTTYTFIAADNGEIVTFNNGSTITVTVPTGLPVGFNCTAIQLGAGQVGFTAASGVTLNAYASGFKIAGQHGSAALISYTSNVYNLSGTLTV